MFQNCANAELGEYFVNLSCICTKLNHAEDNYQNVTVCSSLDFLTVADVNYVNALLVKFT